MSERMSHRLVWVIKKDTKDSLIIGDTRDIKGEKMKVILLTLVLIACASCQNLKIGWMPADSADVEGLTYYTVYKWEGDSTAWQNWQITDMDSIGTLPHVLNFAGPYEFQTYFDKSLIICAGACVRDGLGRQSIMALSRFYFYPSNLEAIWIGK